MKIIHISDTHISLDKKHNHRRLKSLLDYIKAEDYDHLIITGDITHDADPKELEIARRLFRSYNLLDSAKMSVVIGNHDIFGGVHKAEDIIHFPSKCKKTNYKEKVKLFCKYFHEVFENTYRPLEDEFFPYVKDLGDIILIGLNSVDKYSKIKNSFSSNGRVSKREFSALKDIFKMDDFHKKKKLVLIHHHFDKEIYNRHNGTSLWQKIERYTMKLRGSKKLLNLFRESGVNLILHGHVHESGEYFRKGIKIINAGASVDGCTEKQMKINVINIYNDLIETEVITISKNGRKDNLYAFPVQEKLVFDYAG